MLPCSEEARTASFSSSKDIIVDGINANYFTYLIQVHLPISLTPVVTFVVSKPVLLNATVFGFGI